LECVSLWAATSAVLLVAGLREPIAVRAAEEPYRRGVGVTRQWDALPLFSLTLMGKEYDERKRSSANRRRDPSRQEYRQRDRVRGDRTGDPVGGAQTLRRRNAARDSDRS